jgi:hypothetical protein
MSAQRRWAWLALLTALGVCIAAPAVAAADDAQPTDPNPAPPTPTGFIPPVASIGNILAQTGSPAAGPLGLPDLSAYAPSLVLGQNPVPAAPGAADPPAVPSLNAFNAGYLLPQNLTPAAPGQGTAAPGIGPDKDNPSSGRIAFLRRLHEMYQDGALKGAFLGQLPKEQLGEPLPGTEPGPGIYIPPGLGLGLTEPAQPSACSTAASVPNLCP